MNAETSYQREIRPAVAAAIFNDKGEVLLQKRKDVNQWCLISGHVEFGETVENAIRREILEETNTLSSVKRMIGIYSSPASQTYTYADKSVQYVTSYFEVELEAQLPENFVNEETAELKYFAIDDIPVDLAQLNPFWLSDALNTQGKLFVR